MPRENNAHQERHARLFRNGRNQAVRIPRELELPGNEVVIHKEGERLILDPVGKRSRLLDLLAEWEPIEDRFPDVDNGTPIGPNDMLIAAHARALNLVLVTDSEREFSRVPGLAVENWLRH